MQANIRPRPHGVCHACSIRQAVAVAWPRGKLLRRRASIIQVQPLKSISIPTNSPMTQKPENGHCSQIMMPKARLITPPSKIQPH